MDEMKRDGRCCVVLYSLCYSRGKVRDMHLRHILYCMIGAGFGFLAQVFPYTRERSLFQSKASFFYLSSSQLYLISKSTSKDVLNVWLKRFLGNKIMFARRRPDARIPQ